nr:DNA methyltransferase [Clostridium grantii]
MWSFPQRGNWLTHKGDYPGNWSPYVPRNIILRYSKENDLILDQFVGSGTTLVEAKLLNRNAIGYDINSNAIRIANTRVSGVEGEGKIAIKEGNAENLIDIKNNTIDLICTHPPYASIIKYSEDLKNDLSLLELNDFYKAMNNVASESYRVLKPNKYCAVLMGDTRRNGYIVPLGFSVMNIFLKSGFKIKEIIIKQQHNCSSTKYWQELSIKRNFYLIAHEYLFVFKKV